jgi:hypothetical protein
LNKFLQIPLRDGRINVKFNGIVIRHTPHPSAHMGQDFLFLSIQSFPRGQRRHKRTVENGHAPYNVEDRPPNEYPLRAIPAYMRPFLRKQIKREKTEKYYWGEKIETLFEWRRNGKIAREKFSSPCLRRNNGGAPKGDGTKNLPRTFTVQIQKIRRLTPGI